MQVRDRRSIVVLILFPASIGSAAFATSTSDVVLIAAAVASHTIGDVGDAFLLMLSEDIPGGVLMAAVAGVSTVVVGLMAGGALRIVVAIQSEVCRVIEGGR